jgi:hypothetical protein
LIVQEDRSTGEVSMALVDKAQMSEDELKAAVANKTVKFEKVPKAFVKQSKDELEKDAAHSAWYWTYWNSRFYYRSSFVVPYWNYNFYGYTSGYSYNYSYYAYNWGYQTYPWYVQTQFVNPNYYNYNRYPGYARVPGY